MQLTNHVKEISKNYKSRFVKNKFCKVSDTKFWQNASGNLNIIIEYNKI